MLFSTMLEHACLFQHINICLKSLTVRDDIGVYMWPGVRLLLRVIFIIVGVKVDNVPLLHTWTR